MKKYTIAYIFRKTMEHIEQQIALKKAPEDIVYGLTIVQKRFHVISLFSPRLKLLTALQYFINRLVLNFVDNIGFSIFPSIFMIPYLRKTDLIFATADTYGLPFALFRKLKVIDKPLIVNTIGLYDGLTRKKARVALSLYKKILKNVDCFVSGGSWQECEKLANLLDLPLERFNFIPFGIDTSFFHPSKQKELNEILTIGVDPSRDWKLFARVAYDLPQEKFRLVTYKGLDNFLLPDNVIREYNITFTELRKRIWQSKYVILLTKENHYFSGQSTMFRCMACAKPVIISYSPSVAAYDLKDGYNCKLVPIGHKQAIISAIECLNHQILRKKIGARARKMILKNCTINQYGQKLSKIFENVLEKKRI